MNIQNPAAQGAAISATIVNSASISNGGALRVYFIDDAWAAPQSNVLASCVPSLRRLFADHEDVRTWFAAEYGAMGDYRTSVFFDAWVANAANDSLFWKRISSSPRFTELREEWGEIANIWNSGVEILEKVRHGLEAEGFDVELYSQLPRFNPSSIPSIIVIDYILGQEADPQKIAESTHWLSGISNYCLQSPDAKPPLVLLISSALNANETETKAKDFRKNAQTMSSYFRLIPKATQNFEQNVVGLAKEYCTVSADKLLQFYSVYKGLRKGYDEATKEIGESIESLELEDLLTFHAAQLKDEGTLDEYLAWLYGQVLTSKLLRKADFVKAGRKVENSDEVLLGQLKPQQLIPQLFYEASFLNTLEQTVPEFGLEKIQFANMYQAKCAPSSVLLVISQTCDLTQCKIKNSHVLCVEGTLTELDVSVETALLKMTIDQITKEHQVYKLGEKFYSVNWGDFKNLRTVIDRHLNERHQWVLMGRMNELYALNIQASAIQAVGRIGLPIVPQYAYYISKISISLVKNKQRFITKEIASGDVIGVIRPYKQNIDIYLASHVREQMAQITDELVSQLKGISNSGAMSELLRGETMRGFTSNKGDMEHGIDFKNGLNIASGGVRSTQARPGFAKVFGHTSMPVVEGGEYLEFLFQPI